MVLESCCAKELDFYLIIFISSIIDLSVKSIDSAKRDTRVRKLKHKYEDQVSQHNPAQNFIS